MWPLLKCLPEGTLLIVTWKASFNIRKCHRVTTEIPHSLNNTLCLLGYSQFHDYPSRTKKGFTLKPEVVSVSAVTLPQATRPCLVESETEAVIDNAMILRC